MTHLHPRLRRADHGPSRTDPGPKPKVERRPPDASRPPVYAPRAHHGGEYREVVWRSIRYAQPPSVQPTAGAAVVAHWNCEEPPPASQTPCKGRASPALYFFCHR